MANCRYAALSYTGPNPMRGRDGDRSRETDGVNWAVSPNRGSRRGGGDRHLGRSHEFEVSFGNNILDIPEILAHTVFMSAHATLRDAILYFADFEHCHKFMVDLRWSDGRVKCPVCGSEKVTYLAKNRVWKCYAVHPKPRFTLKTGTIFEDSPIPLEKWLPAVWMILNDKNGISSWELHRAIGVTQKTAWFMLHRIRLAMQSKTFNKLGGEVEVDETFIGGKARNMHKSRRQKASSVDGGMHGGAGKAIVMGMLQRGGTVRTAVVEDQTKPTMQ